MILADKLIKLRKKSGMSQEELAEKMGVSRQAVSKWEGAQSIPDLDKILMLANLFSVTTDYLLKDNIDEEEHAKDVQDSISRRVGLNEANEYLESRKRASWQIALATLLCILSPVTLIVLGGLSDIPSTGIGERLMGIVGLSALFLFIICAIPMFILVGFKNAPYEFLDDGEFELEYGVNGIVSERKKEFTSTYIRWNIIGVILCIFSVVPLIITAFFENEIITIVALAFMIITVGIAAFAFIVIHVRMGSMDRLLKENDFSEKEKNDKSKLSDAVDTVFWCLIIATYFAWSFLTGAWHISWVVFVIGGMLSPAINALCEYVSDKKTK